MAAITLDRARQLLRGRASVPDTRCGPGRRHDLFVTHEAMSPAEWKARGLTLVYGFYSSPSRTGVRKPVLLMICDGAGRGHDFARMRHTPPRWRDASSIPACGNRTDRCGWS
jgi:hypothetical protein